MINSTWRESSKNHVNHEQLNNYTNYNKKSEALFRLHIPEFFKKQIDFSNENDPLLLQVLPHNKELIPHANYINDPVGDLVARQNKGVIHKYKGRVLLITTGACAINCRYCFRRVFPYSHNNASSQDWQSSIDYIKDNPDIQEVILSGGDPLMLSTKILNKLTDKLAELSHIKTLRIHTRIPIVAPNRITKNFLSWLSEIQLKKVMVLHCNHANELSNKHHNIFNNLKKTSTQLLNQSVLLKNINDDAATLIALSQRLFDFGILPYYLHQLDKVKSTKHFRVKNSKAIKLSKKLRQGLPGYLVPKLVTEIAGKKSKTLLF